MKWTKEDIEKWSDIEKGLEALGISKIIVGWWNYREYMRKYR
ncbi:MAG: hypothetical protein ACE5KE_00380 [Methanosarcinales archaeon]